MLNSALAHKFRRTVGYGYECEAIFSSKIPLVNSMSIMYCIWSIKIGRVRGQDKIKGSF